MRVDLKLQLTRLVLQHDLAASIALMMDLSINSTALLSGLTIAYSHRHEAIGKPRRGSQAALHQLQARLCYWTAVRQQSVVAQGSPLLLQIMQLDLSGLWHSGGGARREGESVSRRRKP
jgi:hypothetical protein